MSDSATLDVDLLDVKAAAKRLGIGTRKLWELTNIGDITSVRIGGRVLYDPADLAAYVERQKVRGV